MADNRGVPVAERAAAHGTVVQATTAPGWPVTDPFRLDGKVAWVTGASGGLGGAIAAGLADAGARVALMGRDLGRLEAVAADIRAGDGDVLVVPGSVTSATEVARAADGLWSAWERLDLLVNCAGISPTISPSEHLDEEVWRRVLDVNLTGTFLCCREAARRMLDVGGSIVNISSVHGRVGMERLAAYAASKGGVEMLTRVLAAEWAERNVRVNAIAPGYFSTPMTDGLQRSERWNRRITQRVPMRRFAQPEELVSSVLYLASDASSFVTGTTLYVDGGWTAT